MTRLFIRFYLGVLLVLFLAWYIHGIELERHRRTEMNRVVEGAHGGGARLVAGEIDSVQPADRPTLLKNLQERFGYPIEILTLDDLPTDERRRISDGDDVVLYQEDRVGSFIFTPLSGGTEVVRLGVLPGPGVKHIEKGLGGGIRLAAAKLDAASKSDRDAVLASLQKRFDYPVEIVSPDDVPPFQRWRIARGSGVVFYGNEDTDQYFVVTPMSSGKRLVRFGPFPNYERTERIATATTLALVLLPAALAIALLLRPVARQLRRVEDAAKAIAAGDLSARVDERRAGSAKTLAQAFNNMAGRTESLVRTQRELLQAVSHELRTPLSRMRFAIELIDTAKDDNQRKQRLKSLDAATEELDDLVGELLSYVRMETTQPQSNREHIALQDALDVLIPKHAALHPSIQFEVSENVAGEEIIISADRAGLQRVLGNLLSNAGRFAGSRVKISAVSTGRTTTVDVDDDGNGIPASQRERVFEPFVRLQDGSSERGVGLGLALVRRIMTQHGGSVEVLASPLGGCKIRTTWPNE
jgi:two-component system sensor histidine kinase RstB